MRFRLGISGTQQTADHFGRGFQSLAMLPMLQAQAADEFQNNELKRAQVQSQIASQEAQRQQATAHAALFGAQADAERRTLERGTVPELVRSAALQNGVPLHQVGEAADYFQTGQLAGKYDTGGLAGPVMPSPGYADPDLGRRIYQTLGLTQQALTVGDKNIEHIAGATGAYQRQDAARRVEADPASAGRVAQSFAAAEGKPLIHAIGNTGEGFNQYTGDGTTLNQGLRVLFNRGEEAQISQRRASAGASNASAEHSRALTRKTNQDISEGQRTSGLAVVTGPNGEVTVVDKVNRTAQPVLGADGRPIIKGTAGGGGKPLTEGQSKANLFGGRMMESDKILSDLEDNGVLNPGVIKSTVQGAAGMVPFIGDKLSEAAGSAMNVLPGALGGPSSAQQQVEQARRDFINAVLRRESGAVISPSEFANAEKQYFPQQGDLAKVREQKRRNRQIATTLMLQEVPEAQRYKLGAGYGASPAAPQAPVAPEGSWGAPAPQGGWSIQRVN